jgi:hypothetical protein
MITAEELRDRLNYDPETGVFTWIDCLRPYLNGRAAGGIDTNGYVVIGINGKVYMAHRLVWLWTHGFWPENQLDHADLNKTNNRLTNLRPANQAQNNHNQNAQRNSKTGVKGVSWHKSKGKWRASTKINRKSVHLGNFNTVEEAAHAYGLAAKERHGEFLRLST